jgi:Fe-S cluster assembly scaffold protein SufB
MIWREVLVNRLTLSQQNAQALIDQDNATWHIVIEHSIHVSLIVRASNAEIKVEIAAHAHVAVKYTIESPLPSNFKWIFLAHPYAHCIVEGQMGTIQAGEMNVVLEPCYNASIEVLVMAIVRGKENIGITSTQVHKEIGSRSLFMLKAIGYDTASLTFNGHIHIMSHATDASAELHAQFLRIDPSVFIKAQPTLAIETKQVKSCKHACIIKGIDKEQLFYFKTRGITSAVAQQLLIDSFLFHR